MLTIAAVLLAFGSPAAAQLADPEKPGGSPLEVTDDGKIIYGGDVAYECASVGSGIVMPAPNSDSKTRAALKRTNEQAIELCTEAGFPPSDSEKVAEDLAADEDGSLVGPPPPPLEVEGNGTLVIGGDVYAVGYCRALVEHPARIRQEKREYVEACEKAGFSVPAKADDMLPETGGPRTVPFVVAALVVAGAILARRISR